MLEKFRKNNKKGFTLVELIVVLVILAILAALLVPALTGYIDKAKQKQIIAETRQIVMAAQTLVDEKYAKLEVGGTGITFVQNKATGNQVGMDEISALAEIETLNIKQQETGVNNNNNVYIAVGTGDNAGKVVKVIYKAHNLTCTYENNDYTVK